MKQLHVKLLCGLFAVALVGLSAGKAEAGLARIFSMGLDQDTVWMIEKDEVYAYTNAAYLGKLAPQLNVGYLAETINPGTAPYGWLIFSPVDKLNLMVSTGLMVDDSRFAATPPNADLDYRQFDIMGSYDLGSMILGVGTSFSYKKNDNGTNKDTTLLWTLNTGIIYTLSSSMNIDAGVLLNVWNADIESTGYDRSVVDFGFNGRFNWSLSEKNTLHIFFKYLMEDRDVAGKNTYHTVTTGVSDQINITKNSFVFVGLQYNMLDNATPGLDSYTHTMTLVLGGEAQLCKYVSGRLGVKRDILSRTTIDPGTNIADTENPAEAFFGLGIHMGNLTFNLNVETLLLTSGPQFISGSANNWSTDFEITYHFETGDKK